MQTITSDPTRDIASLNTFVAQMENSFQGLLTKIGNDGTNTTLDIDVLGGIGATNAKVTTSAAPTGATIINQGTIFVSGSLTAATAYR